MHISLIGIVNTSYQLFYILFLVAKVWPNITQTFCYDYLLLFRMPSKQSQAWTFTVNNYTEKCLEQVESLKDFSSYLVVGKEVGEKKGTPHLQGYVYMIKKCTMKALKRVVPRGSFYVSRGSDFDNFGYSQKQDLWLKHGTPPCQGKRTDLDDARECTTMREVVMIATNVQQIMLMEKKLVYAEPQRKWMPKVIWLYGEPGVGKTMCATTAYDDVHIQNQFKWWQGYDGHEVVVFDDMRSDFCKFNELLKLLDRNAYVVETKGGSRQLRARVMYITSPFAPWELYTTIEDKRQLYRRIRHVLRVSMNEFGDSVYQFMQNPWKRHLICDA